MTEFYTKDELTSLYGKTYATMVDDSLIPKGYSSYKDYSENLVPIVTPRGTIEIPVLLIKDLLSKPELYKHLLNNLDAMDGYPIKLKYIENGKVLDVFKISKADLVFALRII